MKNMERKETEANYLLRSHERNAITKYAYIVFE